MTRGKYDCWNLFDSNSWIFKWVVIKLLMLIQIRFYYFFNTGGATNFGDLIARRGTGAVSNETRGVCCRNT